MLVTREEILEHAEADGRVLDADVDPACAAEITNALARARHHHRPAVHRNAGR